MKISNPPVEIHTPVIVLVGPTAIGKTGLSITIAQEYDCEVVSVDSMQVYRHMDIGTAKIRDKEKQGIVHHLIDIVDPDDEYNVARFVEDALASIREIQGKNRIPLLTGGTGLYLNGLRNGLFEGVPSDERIREKLIKRVKEEGTEALHEELAQVDDAAAAKIHPNDTTRIIRALEVYLSSGINMSQHLQTQRQSSPSVVFRNILIIGLKCPRDQLYKRIDQRTEAMIEEGLEGEVNKLLGMGYSPELKSMQSIGYRHMCNYINGNWSKNELLEYLARDTRRYAKRQFTWFNRDTSIHWIEKGRNTEIMNFISGWFNSLSLNI